MIAVVLVETVFAVAAAAAEAAVVGEAVEVAAADSYSRLAASSGDRGHWSP